ncbi:ATP-binding cassette domain-containing protein [Pseudonocardia sp. RS11V-5]|uniref:ABC transporter ATP-binding protein n=1 Tax=Pseudonocardia terrae TaxID=2905831 RepID=UPI001E335A09|nr:ATP-binding cassette domain-containing protein [Pseudonocardia terrae]MCE3550877.1 ATP-binding cassette domain-containing protein [Pseudonocardia terrae]
MTAAAADPAPNDVALAVRNVTKTFKGVRALTDVSIDFRRGRITGFVGPNGAGKSTLVNVASGLLHPDSGRIELDGKDVTGLGLAAHARLGIVRTFQHPRLFGGHTAGEMVRTALRAPSTDGRTRDAGEVLAHFALEHVTDVVVDDLPYGTKKLLNVAIAWALRPRVLLLDEPFAGVGHGDRELFVDAIAAVAESGVAVGLIEHNVGVVMRLSSQLVVLDSGRVIFDGDPVEGQRDPEVLAAYFGDPDAPALPAMVGENDDE